MTINRVRVLVLVLGIMAVFSIVYGQFAVPRSNKIIEGDLSLPSAVSAHFQVREGAMLTVRYEEQDRWYGVVPVIDERNDLKLTTFILEPGPDGPAVQEVLSSIDAKRGRQTPLSIQGYDLAVGITKTFPAKFPTIPLVDPRGADPLALQKVYGASGGGLCSLTCGSVTVTATSVVMSCGSCEGAR